jgi:hypothetical protein
MKISRARSLDRYTLFAPPKAWKGSRLFDNFSVGRATVYLPRAGIGADADTCGAAWS